MRRGVHTQGGRVVLCAEGYIPRVVGVPGSVYLPICPYPVPGVYHPVYAPMYTPGYTILHTLSDTGYTGPAAVHDDETLGSTLGLIREKRLSGAFLSLILLGLLGTVCAELLRFSLRNNVRDWIDEGSSLGYTLWLGCCAQSGVPVSHPIVVGNEARLITRLPSDR